MFEKLHIIPYEKYSNKIVFYCGNKELDDFINTDEVQLYEREMLGKTSLAILDNKLAAFFTLANTVIRDEWLKKRVNQPKMRQQN